MPVRSLWRRAARAFGVFALACFIAAAGGAPPAFADALDRVRETGELRWGADLEGGAPYVYPDPANPAAVTGFEAELAGAIAARLGVRARLVHNAWDSLVPALERGAFDVALNGLEITPERMARVRFSRPYYVYAQQLVTRSADTGLNTLAALRGHAVGTLAASAAEGLLEHEGRIDVRRYASNVQPYDDLLIGRVDGVLLDNPIATVYGRRPGLRDAGAPFAPGLYGIAMRPAEPRLAAAIDQALAGLIQDGTLEGILTRYRLWNDLQARREAMAEALARPAAPTAGPKGFWSRLVEGAPLLARGTAMTLAVSVLAMALAVALGLTLAMTRLYAPRALQIASGLYVEAFRGTPLLIQLFLIYYGLPTLGVKLDAFVAAVLGLGLNYAAYEAENYRAALQALPAGQQEAARALGMSQGQALRFVLLPQALRLAIPPVTNDFIALFKDSSVVSIITMVELTKAYGMLASASYDYIGFGLVTAFIYFAISFPAARLARHVEKRQAARLRR